MDTNTGKLNLAALRKACSSCSLQDLCLPLGLSAQGLVELEQVVESLGPLHKGDHLFRQGDVFRSIYVVRSGYFKTYSETEGGQEYVLGFYMSGELLGLGSINAGRKQCSAEALDTAMVCRLPFEGLSRICCAVPELQAQLLRLMSRELFKAEALSSGHSVDSRMAAFLLDWGERLARRGFSRHHFTLPMSRQDIGNHLRLAPETVSRCLAEFVRRRWVEIQRREVKLTDGPALAALRESGDRSL